MLNILFTSGFLAPIIVLATAFYQVHFYESSWQEISAGDCLLIMGAKVLPGNIPDIMMQERVETAAPLITPVLKSVILTGGTVDQKKSEAEVMRDLLLKRGIEEKKMILEREATSTFQNLVFSKPLMLKADCEKLDIVSHRFHLPRIAMTAKRLGIAVNRLIPAKEERPITKGRIERELKAYLWYILFLSSRPE